MKRGEYPVSLKDRDLFLGRYVNRVRMRCESTLRPDQLGEAVMITNLLDSGGELIIMIDLTPINRIWNFHSFSLETLELYVDLYERLTYEPTPHNRLLYISLTPDGAVYWVLTHGR